MGGNATVRFFYSSSRSFQYWNNWSLTYLTCDAKLPTVLPKGNVYYTLPLAVQAGRTWTECRGARGGWAQQTALEFDPCSALHWGSAAVVQETHAMLRLCSVVPQTEQPSWCMWDLPQVRAWPIWAPRTWGGSAQIWHQSRQSVRMGLYCWQVSKSTQRSV